MAKYIDKFTVSDMLTRLENELQQYEPFTPRERAIYCKVHETGIMIALMRSEDVAPVRHGRWECGKPCPVCGEDRFKGLDADIWADWEPPYCPNCGAKMTAMPRTGVDTRKDT